MRPAPAGRWQSERGSTALRTAVILAILLGVGYGAAYAYGSLRVGQIETTLSQRMADAGRLTPTEPTVDEELVKKRLVKWAQEEGAETTAEQIAVTIEPLNPTNFEKLPMQARVAIGAVSKMKNWEADAAFLGIRMTVRAKWGPVKREIVLERSSWVPKSALR
jgi:phage tail sheath protein FI